MTLNLHSIDMIGIGSNDKYGNQCIKLISL